MFGATFGSFLTAAWAAASPFTSAKYSVTKPFGTPGSRPRSIAYLTSCETTGLFQPVPPPVGGLYFTFVLMWNVMVLPPLVTTG